MTLVIDEFQKFPRINPAVFSQMQEIWDLSRRTSHVHLMLSGSAHSMMNRIFHDAKEPLFGRLDREIRLKPFRTDELKVMLRDYAPAPSAEEWLALFLLTGGMPKYAEALMDAGACAKAAMLRRVVDPDGLFLWEGRTLLVSELGDRYGPYFAILEGIAAGRTSWGELAGFAGKSLGPCLERLETELGLVERVKPLFAKPESRNARYAVSDDFS